MQMKAENIGGDTWLVEEFEVQNLPVEITPEIADPVTGKVTTPAAMAIQPVDVVTARHKVAVAMGGTAQDAIDALVASTAAPSADEAAAQEAARRREAIRLETERRIFTAIDEKAQMNLVSAAGAGLLTAEQLAVYRDGVLWVGAMRAAYAGMIADPKADFTADASWPAIPTGVQALVDQF